jgi:hypothetical protein
VSEVMLVNFLKNLKIPIIHDNRKTVYYSYSVIKEILILKDGLASERYQKIFDFEHLYRNNKSFTEDLCEKASQTENPEFILAGLNFMVDTA